MASAAKTIASVGEVVEGVASGTASDVFDRRRVDAQFFELKVHGSPQINVGFGPSLSDHNAGVIARGDQEAGNVVPYFKAAWADRGA